MNKREPRLKREVGAGLESSSSSDDNDDEDALLNGLRAGVLPRLVQLMMVWYGGLN